jgi:hypothetical protein
MSFSIQLSTDLVSVDAGDNTPVTIQVANRGEEVDRFELEIEGVDAEWTAVPVPIFSVAAGETQTEKIFFRTQRVSESLAGNYPFVVKVRSLNSGETRTAQGVLHIKPYNHLSMEIVPKKGAVTPVRSAEVFHASIVNLGNTDQTVQIYGSDPEDAFAFEFAQEQVNIGPGQQKDIEIRATPTSSRTFAGPRLHVFTVSARSIQTPSLVTSSQAQIEQRPLVTPGSLVVALVILLIAFVWFLSRPQPAVLDLLTVDPTEALVGDMVTVRWHSTHATSVQLRINDQELTVDPDGSRTFSAQESGTVTATAVTESKQSQPRVVSFEVKKPQVVPDARITLFDIKPREVNVGQSFTVYYTVNDATTKLTLAPRGQVLDPKIGQQEIKADEKGVFKFYLVAENANNKAANSKTITVKVTEASQAHVVFFDVEPKAVDALNGNVKIQWQLSDAARAQLSVNGQLTDLPTTSGESTVPVSRNTEFVLVAYDTKGLVVRSPRIFVRVKPPTPPEEPTTTGSAPATAGGGNNNPPPVTTGGGR